MAVRIDPRSRLQFANLVKVNGRQFWDLPVLPIIEPQTDDLVYQWDEVDTKEKVADAFYQDSSLWWVIARRNGISDMPFGVKTGDVIVVPSRRYVYDVLPTLIGKVD